MSGHTKGPWRIPHFADEKASCACSYIFSDAQRGFGAIATIQFGGENENYETAKANANLIAAAPDLLEALIDVRRALEVANFTGELAVVDAAIAKARGEA